MATAVFQHTGAPLKPRDLTFNLVTNATAGAILYFSLGDLPKMYDMTPANDRATLRAALIILAKKKDDRTPEEQQLLENLRNAVMARSQKTVATGSIGPAYKALPMDGIRATAPYLHNGSVASLWELMLPEEQRLKSFPPGSPRFDPVKVGVDTTVTTNFILDTALPGNSNKGHSGPRYGTDLSDAQKWAIVEYMKTL